MQMIPRIYFKGNCREAIELYQSTFSGSIDYLMTFGDVKMGTEEQKNLIVNSQVDLGGHKLHMADNMGMEVISGNQLSFTVVLDNPAMVKDAYAKLKSEGTVIMEPVPTFFSPCHCSLTDKFGVTWQINCPKQG